MTGRLSLMPVEPETEPGMLVLDVPDTVCKWVVLAFIPYVFYKVPAILLAYDVNFASYKLDPLSPPPISMLIPRGFGQTNN